METFWRTNFTMDWEVSVKKIIRLHTLVNYMPTFIALYTLRNSNLLHRFWGKIDTLWTMYNLAFMLKLHNLTNTNCMVQKSYRLFAITG